MYHIKKFVGRTPQNYVSSEGNLSGDYHYYMACDILACGRISDCHTITKSYCDWLSRELPITCSELWSRLNGQ